MTDGVPTVRPASARASTARWCRTITEARWFAVTVFCLILANAALLGAETYSGVVSRWHGWSGVAEHACVAAFTVEILLRLGAHADRPKGFFRDPWNLFDLAVVLSTFLPLVRENTTVLRLLRLARVLRTARFLPQLRIVLVAVARSLPGTLSFLLVGALLLYVYAMVGWVFFAHHDPQHYGSVGRAALTLFLLMTLDGIGDAVHAGLEVSRWSLLYYASYVLFASFVLVNVLIGVVLTSLDEARDLERDTSTPEGRPASGPADQQVLLDRIATARRALDDLERELTHVSAQPGAEAGRTAPAPNGRTRPRHAGDRPVADVPADRDGVDVAEAGQDPPHVRPFRSVPGHTCEGRLCEDALRGGHRSPGPTQERTTS